MSYIRRNTSNTQVNPQPTYSTITLYSGSEGWSTRTYKVWTGNYVARNSDNTTRTPGVYQKRNVNNQSISPGTYQRYDVNNTAINN